MATDSKDTNLVVTTTALGSGLLDETLVVTDPRDYEAPRKPEAAGEHLIASTTDSWEAIETAAPVPLEKSSLADFRELEGSGTRTTSYEAADSSRHRVEEQFAEYQADLDRLKFPEDPELLQDLTDEAGVELEPETTVQSEAQNVEPSVPYSQVQDVVETQMLMREHAQRVQVAMQDPAYAEFVAQTPPVDVPWHPAIGAAVIAQNNSPAMVAFLSARPDLAQEIASMPVARGVAEVAKLSAWLQTQLTGPAAAPAPRRAVSNAPAPIKPVGGSSTRSAVPRDDMDYQTYKRVREAEIRAHRRGERER